jgi:hypothetical protein
MSKVQLRNETELIHRVIADALSSKRENFVFQAGHFPLFYRGKGKDAEAYAALDQWGAFTPYSMELACKIGKELKQFGNVRFAVIADDVFYDHIRGVPNYNHSHKRGMRKRFYKSHSGADAKLPEPLNGIMQANGFSSLDIIRHDHRQFGRRDCLFFGEKVLRADGSPAKNQCARAYREFVSNPKYFVKEKDYLISFVPDRCMGNICNGVLEDLGAGVSASHIFMQTDSTLVHMTDRTGIWNDRSVYYRRDGELRKVE